MIIQRKRYVEKLINKQWNGRIKILTGIRRCGKSTILFDLFLQNLLSQNVNREDIITLALDDDQNEQFRDPGKLSEYVRAKCSDPRKKYYVFLDEIQFAISKKELRNPDQPVRLYSVLNGFLHMKNIDVYVTGSNSKLLSKDVLTEFRGRGDVIHIFPLSFAEYYAASGRDKMDAYDEFAMYGGMPYLLNLQTDEDKYDYLDNLFEEIYFKDIEERYAIQLPGVLRDLTSSLCSSIGSLTNASKIARTVNSSRSSKTDSETISQYLSYLMDSFLFSRAERYDVKGKRYFDYPSKFYCTDIGLRNVRLGMRQMEPTHIMENIIYCDLIRRGYDVDVGLVEQNTQNAEGRNIRNQLEVDFVVNRGGSRVYIQSALNVEAPEKRQQETASLIRIPDSFAKIIVVRDDIMPWRDDNGILYVGVCQFLTDESVMLGAESSGLNRRM